MSVVEVELPAERSRLCEHVLRDLPDWFGIEEATAAYISDVDEGYARTRAFYETRGFVPLEELHDLWDHNPCLLLVKHL